MLTQKELKTIVIMTECGNLVWRRKPDTSWQAKRFNKQYAGELIKTSHHTGYDVCNIYGKQYGLHRIVWLYVYGHIPSKLDHINQNKRDNSIDNLRIVNSQLNGRNRSINKNNKSGVMGVFFCNTRKKWKAQIKFNMKQSTIGYFSCFFDAVCARKSKEIDLGFHSNHGNSK
tara:strand:- start:620 stop:1135 length:516 start_codon:yes stop_codon:yes gene_type:complete